MEAASVEWSTTVRSSSVDPKKSDLGNGSQIKNSKCSRDYKSSDDSQDSEDSQDSKSSEDDISPRVMTTAPTPKFRKCPAPYKNV
jgi:hypothetical protein